EAKEPLAMINTEMTKVAITKVIVRCCFFIWLSPLVLNNALYRVRSFLAKAMVSVRNHLTPF
ncbi:MAG: hypothetical protein ACXACD_11005, partial [Candidatus Thorarchaeota archaeon]